MHSLFTQATQNSKQDGFSPFIYIFLLIHYCSGGPTIKFDFNIFIRDQTSWNPFSQAYLISGIKMLYTWQKHVNQRVDQCSGLWFSLTLCVNIKKPQVMHKVCVYELMQSSDKWLVYECSSLFKLNNSIVHKHK
jgi:hypothetical protein